MQLLLHIELVDQQLVEVKEHHHSSKGVFAEVPAQKGTSLLQQASHLAVGRRHGTAPCVAQQKNAVAEA